MFADNVKNIESYRMQNPAESCKTSMNYLNEAEISKTIHCRQMLSYKICREWNIIKYKISMKASEKEKRSCNNH